MIINQQVIQNLETGREKKPKIYFGWWTVLVTGIISGLGHGFYSYGISIFFKDLAAELSINRATTSLAAGIGRLEGGITSPATGWLSDRYGPKWVIFTGTFLAGIGLILMYFINSVWSYMVVWGVVIGVGLNIGLTVSVDKALNDWFVKQRGLAHGTKFALIGILGVVLVPVVTWLVFYFGWRITCLIWGVLILFSAPFLLIFVKQKIPEHYGLLPDGEKVVSRVKSGSSASLSQNIPNLISVSSEPEFSLKQALRSSTYWLICLAFGAQTMTVGALNIHLVPFLTDIGIEQKSAGIMMGLMVLCTIPSRFFGGLLSDRVPKVRLQYFLAAVLFLMAIGMLTFLIFGNKFSVYIFLICFGISSGAATPLLLVMTGRYFGRKAFGIIIGSSLAVRAPLSLVAPVFAGWVCDQTGSYNKAFFVFTALSVLATILLCFTKPPKMRDNKKKSLGYS
jgi:MFS family permease